MPARAWNASATVQVVALTPLLAMMRTTNLDNCVIDHSLRTVIDIGANAEQSISIGRGVGRVRVSGWR